MMSIVYIFWMYVILFAVIGAMRGWAKELLVAFSVITALAVRARTFTRFTFRRGVGRHQWIFCCRYDSFLQPCGCLPISEHHQPGNRPGRRSGR